MRVRPSSNSYKPLIIKITRKIPLEIEKTRQTIYKSTGLTLEQELLEFCRVPRYAREIRKHLGLKSNDRVTKGFTNPLIEQGQLKYTVPENHASVFQMYLNAEVERTPEIEEMILQKSKKEKTAEMQEKVLVYCAQPRTLHEIAKHLGKTWNQGVGKYILKPLIVQGKLRFIYPHHGSNQQYVNTDVKLNLISEESIIEFCKTPRLVKEIRDYFNITVSVYSSTVRPLMRAGKLVYTKEYEKTNKHNAQRRLTSTLDWVAPVRIPVIKKTRREVKSLKTINKETGLTVEQKLLEYCKEPRTIYQLIEFLGGNTKTNSKDRFIIPLMKQGKIKFTLPESPSSNYQRYLNAEIEFTCEMQTEIDKKIKTEEDIELEQKALNFCKEPRSSGEIMRHLGLGDYASVQRRVIRPLMDQGKIKFKFQHDPHYASQKYMLSEADDVPLFTEENIIEFCKTPRFKYEISEHFNIGRYLCKNFVEILVEKSRLKYIKSVTIDNRTPHRMLISNG